MVSLHRIAYTALGLVLCSTLSAQGIKRIQFPAISPNGETIVFSWQNDLWKVARTGGQAVRLTVHAATESRPKWFPDGSRIAFTSNRMGSTDVFTMKPDGTDIKRVTFDSSTEIVTDISADGRWIFGHTNYWSRGDLFRVNASGGDLVRLTSHPFESSFGANLSADGKKVFYTRGAYRETAWQKPSMQSSALPEIWVAENTVPLINHKRLTNNEFTDMFPMAQADGSVLAVTNRNGFPNIWRIGSADKALTNHKDGTSRYPSSSADGKYVAYEFESSLMLLDTTTGLTSEVKVNVPSDERINPVQDITVSSGVSGFSVSPDGKRAVVEARGDLFLIPEKGGTTRRLTTNVARDGQSSWLDAKNVVFSSMEGNTVRLKSVNTDGVVKDFVSDSLDLFWPMVSPDSTMVAFVKGDSQICIADPTGKSVRTLVRGNFSDAFDGPVMSWSPDSKYLAVNMIEGQRTRVCLVDAKTGKVTTVAKMVNKPQQGSVSTPQFLLNGKGVFFTSPEFDERDLFMVDLVPAEVTFTEDDLDKIDTPPSKDKPLATVEIYEPGIGSRLRRLTTRGCNSATSSPDGRAILATTPNGLVSISSVSGASQTLIAASAGSGGSGVPSAVFTLNGKVYAASGSGIGALVLGGQAPAVAPISFSSTFALDTKAEEKALFNEIWWALDRQYYDPAMHKKDWAGLKRKFEFLVPQAYDRTDFYRLMGEMMEELDSSHLGATAPPAEAPGSGNESTGYLGVDLDPDILARDGVLVVKGVVPGSPATHPSSILKDGDRILEVNGVSVDTAPLGALLKGKVGRKVVLKITRGGVSQEVTIKPMSLVGRQGLEYDAWVSNQRSLVEKLSAGKLGYMHIRAMDQASLQQFLREIRTEGFGRKGMIIDVRFNGGGSTAVDVLGVLIKTPWMIRTTRGEFGLKLSENIYRGDALELPTALLCNTFSFSNAEVITEGFRKLKLGPIVGERTPGYVIGTGALGLWDGGTIRMPVIGAYAVNGDNLENNGRRPDFTVWFDPNAWMEGRDLQLEKAVTEMLKGNN